MADGTGLEIAARAGVILSVRMRVTKLQSQTIIFQKTLVTKYGHDGIINVPDKTVSYDGGGHGGELHSELTAEQVMEIIKEFFKTD